MKLLISLLFISLFTSCAMTQQDWQRAAAISGGSAQLYNQMETANAQRDLANYQIEQQAIATRNSRATSDCDLNCRQQKHDLETHLLYLQMQNATNAANGYPGY